jgi:hypothetical protein
MNFLDINKDFAVRRFREILLQLFDFGTFAPDNNTRARSANGDPQLIAWAIDFDGTHAGRLQTFTEIFLELYVFLKELGKPLFCKPARTPRLSEANAEPIRMNFLSHSLLDLFRHFDYDMRRAPLIPIGAPHGSGPDSFAARTLIDIRFRNAQRIYIYVIRQVLSIRNS